MKKVIALSTVLALGALGFGCDSGTAPNGNGNTNTAKPANTATPAAPATPAASPTNTGSTGTNTNGAKPMETNTNGAKPATTNTNTDKK